MDQQWLKMEEISRFWLSLAKIIIKYVPFIIAVLYFISSVGFCFGINCVWLGLVYRYSFMSFICLLAMSILLKFCVWHRLPLYYSVSMDIINIIDYYFIIPINSKVILLFYLTFTILFIIIGMCLKERYNAKNRIS